MTPTIAPEFLARVRDPAQGYVSVPFASDVELAMRMAPSPKRA
jgi:hypothetical protein